MAGPLAGVRVVELAGIGPIPFAGMVLADLGADVVRVDRLESGPLADLSRNDPTFRGRRSIALDLKHEGAIEVVLRLVEKADILIEGFRPGVAERLGVGPEPCQAINPGLVYGRMTGWGQEGPRAMTAGHDITYLALTGVLSAIGPESEPMAPLNLVADYGGGGMLLLVGVLAALDHVRRTGEGQVVDAAMVDGVALLTAMVRGGLAAGWWQDRRQANLLDGAAPFYRTYRTADGEFLAVGALEPQFYAAFLRGLGLAGEDLPGQYQTERWAEVSDRLATVIGARNLAEWVEIFSGTDACVAPVRSWSAALSDPHLLARETFFEGGGVHQPSPAPRFSVTATTADGVPVEAGAHTAEVLTELGYTEDEIGKLLREHIAVSATLEE